MSKDIQLFWRIILLKIGMLLHWNTFKKKKIKKIFGQLLKNYLSFVATDNETYL